MSLINSNDKVRSSGLDLFRVFLAFWVLSFHSRISVLNCSYGIFNTFVDLGAMAMTGFFLLSGYVINLTYHREEMSNTKVIKKFNLKRLIAIMPLYLTLEIIYVIIDIVSNGRAAAFKTLLIFPVEILGIQTVFSSLFSFLHVDWFLSCSAVLVVAILLHYVVELPSYKHLKRRIEL